MLVLVLEFSKISATTLNPAPISGDQGTSWSERPANGHHSRNVAAPPKRKTRVRTYAAVT